MKILITGARGFLGRNLICALQSIVPGENRFGINEKPEILPYDIGDEDKLSEYCRVCDYVYHLAGVNRADKGEEFIAGNVTFTQTLVDTLETFGNPAHIAYSSSIQAGRDTDYGRTKARAEEILLCSGRGEIFRFPNLFGMWGKPSYNSVVATFCHNISRNIPIKVDNPNAEISLLYVQDAAELLINQLSLQRTYGIISASPVYETTVGELEKTLYRFRDTRDITCAPRLGAGHGELEVKLYSTYLTYVPADMLSYPLKMNGDFRGTFCELLRDAGGQVSINTANAGVTRGGHYHLHKAEKFFVVSGSALIRLRRIDSDEIISIRADGDCITCVDIPAGYTHSIENIGNEKLITVMWIDECYDISRPDTYRLDV